VKKVVKGPKVEQNLNTLKDNYKKDYAYKKDRGKKRLENVSRDKKKLGRVEKAATYLKLSEIAERFENVRKGFKNVGKDETSKKVRKVWKLLENVRKLWKGWKRLTTFEIGRNALE